ncbi:MAG TPA: hypothetical protein VFO38_01910 [Candidatus Saccharimonadales bacterium]|nr:hypothetical protein [Candidatus Saccharimonadales bacterium]
MKRIISALSFTVFVFGFAGWVYIANNAVHHPETLALPLTHMLPFPREDQFAIACYALSFIALFTYMYLRDDKTKS